MEAGLRQRRLFFYATARQTARIAIPLKDGDLWLSVTDDGVVMWSLWALKQFERWGEPHEK
jgi:hypothetical protein